MEVVGFGQAGGMEARRGQVVVWRKGMGQVAVWRK